ncbi:toxin glutamine deamidase domain-containing protein [Micromonospora echinaurantiaca]|uniref:toxin glutamine deamidase domain-containing protein n=1 Tax=Micromonospora echinaurantiaca TaxID=47857 RepID=UPI00371D5CD0
MAGEVLAEQAASLATGQGPTSLEDAARAAVSGARGALTGQADAALRGRLDGQLSVLAGVSGQGIGDLPTPAVQLGAESSTSGGEPVASAGSEVPAVSAALAAPVAEGVVPAQRGAPGAETLPAPAAAEASRAGDPERHPADLANSAEQSHQTAGTPGGGLGTPTPIGTSADGSGDSTSNPTLSIIDSAPPAPRPTLSAEAGAPIPASPAPTAAGALIGGSVPTVADAAIGAGVPSIGGGTAGVPASTTPGGEAGPPSPPRAGAAATAPPGAGSVDQRPAPSARFPLLDALAPVRPPTRAGATAPERGGPPPPAPANRYAEQWAIDRDAFERRRYRGYYESQRAWFEENRRRDEAARLRARAEEHHQRARDYTIHARRLDRAGQPYLARTWQRYADDETRAYGECQDLADEVLAGTAVPSVVGVHDPSEFRRINDDVGDLAVGAVETADRSALTGDDDPPPIDRSRRYGRPGGLRPPLALHQTDVERRVPREPDGSVTRTADPRQGDWFRLLNDGGPAADPTRGINCLDCTLSLFDTWMHGRPRVSAPRTFDAYQAGDVTRPLDGERDGVGRIEDVTGGRFQRLCQPGSAMTAGERRQAMETGYRNLHDQLLLGGHGTFAFVINSWEQGGSHIWVALNQHGTVLYLDPQTGRIADQPLYRHSGAPHPRNAVDADILVLGPDGRPMPMAGLRRGRFSARPDLPEYPPAVNDEGYGEPYVNRMHLLDGPGAAAPPDAAGPPDHGESGGTEGDRPERLREQRERARRDRLSRGTPICAVLVESRTLDQVFAAGVTPHELAAEVDQPGLRRFAPGLDGAAGDNLVRLFADPRVRDMLDRAWREPPRGEPMLAETLVRQLIERPELVRMLPATPELLTSLTVRPLTLHHLASHQQAIDVLDLALARVAEVGVPVAAREVVPPHGVISTGQQAITDAVSPPRRKLTQPGFDLLRRHDEDYRLTYLDGLYADASIAQQELNKLVVAIAGDQGAPGWRKEPKDRQRALDKIAEYDQDVSLLKDLAAARIQFTDLDALYQGLRRVSQTDGVVMLAKKDRFLRPQISGYRDVLLSLRMSNGHLAELRLQLTVLDDVAEWEHALYEIRRDLDSVAEDEGRSLTTAEVAIQNELLRWEQRAFASALERREAER